MLVVTIMLVQHQPEAGSRPGLRARELTSRERIR
jgi:hypothetical protein